MANIDGIDTTVASGVAARGNGRVSSAGERAASGIVASRRVGGEAGDRVELSASARQAASDSAVRTDLVDRVRAEIENDPDDYINRTLNANIDTIIDAIARDLFDSE